MGVKEVGPVADPDMTPPSGSADDGGVAGPPAFVSARTEFEAFIEDDGPRLFRLCVLIAGNVAGGEDLYQDCIERLWRRSKPAEWNLAYARRIAVNRGIDATRRRRRWVKAAPRLLHRESEDDLAPEADERAAVLAALALLTPRQRTAVALRFWLDRTDAETADDMGCSVSTVRTHVADALKRLRAAGMGEGHEGVDDGSG